MQLHASRRCKAQQSQLMLQRYSRGVMETLGSGGVRLEPSWDSEHDICIPSAQGTVALEVGGKNPQPGNMFLFGFVFVLCE